MEARTTLSASVVSSLRDARQFLDSCLLTVHSRVQVRTNETFTDLSQITAIRVADVQQVPTDSSAIGYSAGNMGWKTSVMIKHSKYNLSTS